MFTYIRQNVRPWMLILAGIIIPFSILFFDAPERDECYQALSVLNYRQSPLAPLTFAGGYLWLKIFGVTVLNLRILSLLCHMIAISIGCWFFWRRTGDRFWSAFMFMTLMTASQVWAMHIYNWDTGCYPFAMLTLVASVAFWRKPSVRRLCVMAVAAALFSLSRIPCAVCVPLLAIVVCVRYRERMLRGILWAVCFMVAASVMAVCFMLLIYGGLDNILIAWNPDNIITGHGAGDIMRYWERVKVITPQLATQSVLPLMLMMYAYIVCKLHVMRWRILLGMVVTVEFVIVFLLLVMPVHTFFCLFFLPVLALLGYPVISRLRDTGRMGRLDYVSWLTLIFICVPVIGSDGFQERFMVLPVFPVLAALHYEALRRYIRAFVVLSFIGALSMTVIKEAYYIKAGLNSVADEAPRLSGLLVDDEIAKSIPAQSRVLSKLRHKGARVAVLGDSRYPCAFIWNLDMMHNLHVFHFESFAEDRHLIEANIGKYDALMVFYPVYMSQMGIDGEVNQADNDAIEEYILSKGFLKADEQFPNFALYYREGI